MRPIKADELRRVAKQEKLDALSAAKEALKDMTPEARAEFISKNDKLWTALLHDLWVIGNQKCWYSEVKLEAEMGEVEHFRPKKKVWKSDPPHHGYWWRAFDWNNFRLAHPLVNKRRKDYSTEQVAGKGCYFPLREENRRAAAEDQENGEEPILLDPIKGADCSLICFDTNSGKPIPRYKASDDGHAWLHQRAKQTINYYHLDEGTWNAKRADLMRDVGIACDRALEAKAVGDELAYLRLVEEIMGFMNEAAEFSTATTQVIAEKGMLNNMFGHPSA